MYTIAGHFVFDSPSLFWYCEIIHFVKGGNNGLQIKRRSMRYGKEDRCNAGCEEVDKEVRDDL